MADLTGEATELLQALIRNRCVNDGTLDAAQEVRSVDILEHHLEGTGLDLQRYERTKGRASLVARIEGADPTAPTLCLMGHTDVVPVTESAWRHDPFGGELIDGEIWGRGAVDMLNMTATMAVAFRHLARTGFKPKGTLVYFAVADEEALGHEGAQWIVDQHWDAVGCDYVITEFGGVLRTGADGRRTAAILVGEKGVAWRRLRVHGTPGHGSQPYGTDNALVTASRVVQQLAEHRPVARLDELWPALVATIDAPADLKAALLDASTADDAIDSLPVPVARRCHATTHTTFSPNVIAGGTKVNVIPDEVLIDVDIRTLPGVTADEVDAQIRDALGDLGAKVELVALSDDPASRSAHDNRLWDVLRRRVQAVYPDVEPLPTLAVGATDARYFRRRGAVGFGAGLFSEAIDPNEFGSRFHGHDERVDVESLRLTTDLWLGVARELLT